MASSRTLLFAVSAVALLTAAPSWAQQAAPAAPAWPQAASDVPADEAVRFGVLPNGMRYAVMRNTTPPGQASLRLRIDAGSLMEREDQLGLAHFIEHMAFNGTEGVPEGELVKTLERLGLAFGPDTNASTSFDETVYKLDLPRTDAETVGAALNILREMTGRATLAADAIDRERGIVLSEERTRDSPSMRALRAQYDFLLRGQLLPGRFPIGDTQVLRTAPRERFVEFYEAYYRPERAALIAVGDFDPAKMEARIRETFEGWSNPAPNGAEPDLGAVAAREAEAMIFVDPGVQSALQLSWVSPPDLDRDSLEERRENLIRYLGLAVLNRRLQSLARSESPPFVAAGGGRYTNTDSMDLATLSASFQPGGLDAALAAVEQEKRRIVDFGVTEAELQRELTEYRASLETYVAGAATRRTPTLAGALSASVNDDEVFVSPRTTQLIFESVVDGLTAADVTAALRTAFEGSGPLLFVTSPVPIEGGETAALAALSASQAIEVAAPAVRETAVWPYTDFGAPGVVVERSEIADLGTTFATFANGVRLTVKPTAFRDQQVIVSVRAGDGFLGLPTDRKTPLWAAGSSFTEGGVGRLTAEQMEEVLAADVYSASFNTGEDSWTLTGATRPEDLEVQLQVLAAYVTDAAWRPEPFERTRRAVAQVLPRMNATPGGVLGREFGQLIRGGDVRWAFPDAADIEAADRVALQAQVEQSLGKGPIEVIIVGDVDLETAIARVAATFGALPARDPAAAPMDDARKVRFPAPAADPVALTHTGRADQALGYVAWPTVDSITDPAEARRVRLLGEVMRLRLIDELREGQAVTYSPSVSTVSSWTFPDYGYLAASIEAPPDKLAGFFADADRIAAELAAAPVTADELERARRPLVESLHRSQNTNEYWLVQLQDVQTDPTRLPAIRSVIADIERVRPGDLLEAAQRYLRPETAWRLQVTPAADAPVTAAP